MEYPIGGDRALKGSGDKLVLPFNRRQEIVLSRENFDFIEVSFSVRYARSVSLTLTKTNLETIIEQRDAADSVSKARYRYLLTFLQLESRIT